MILQFRPSSKIKICHLLLPLNKYSIFQKKHNTDPFQFVGLYYYILFFEFEPLILGIYNLTPTWFQKYYLCFISLLTLSMMVAALDVLTVMDTTARVIPTAATTNT